MSLTTRGLPGCVKRSVVGFKSYLVFYLIEEEGIIDVIRVLHGARDISAVLGDDSIDP
jgi:plasmid stabilization system protein ParE